MYQPAQEWTIEDIKTANRVRGGHWFSPGALRFFRSRIGQTIYQGPGGIYFVTSEQYASMAGPLETRRYTVRKFDPATSAIETIGPFNQLSRSVAVRRADRLAKGIV